MYGSLSNVEERERRRGTLREVPPHQDPAVGVDLLEIRMLTSRNRQANKACRSQPPSWIPPSRRS